MNYDSLIGTTAELREEQRQAIRRTLMPSIVWVNDEPKVSAMTDDDSLPEIVQQAYMPQESQARKDLPLARGLLDYFPAALAAVAEVSRYGNVKHNGPDAELHHARGKSMDHADCIVRHLVDRGALDMEDGLAHSAKVAWRALALLQEELEGDGAPMARGAR